MKRLLFLATILMNAYFIYGQQTFTPHVVFDDNNRVYAVKATPSLFLKFIDSTGEFLTKHVTNGKDYIGKGHTVKLVPEGQETSYESKPEAQALLDYWNQLQLMREMKKKKPAHYGD